jgi:hypothetical protein
VGVEELAERLSALAEELGELAYDRLQEASATVRSGDEPDPALLAEERRITRARRAVEKAASLLGAGGGRPSDEDEGAEA